MIPTVIFFLFLLQAPSDKTYHERFFLLNIRLRTFNSNVALFPQQKIRRKELKPESLEKEVCSLIK